MKAPTPPVANATLEGLTESMNNKMRLRQYLREKALKLWINIVVGPFEMALSLAVAILGFAGLASGTALVPASIEQTLPVWLVYAWSVGLALGGTLTIVGRMLEMDRVETVGLELLIYGNFVYCAVLLIAGSWPSAIPTFVVMVGLIAGASIRISVLVKARQIVRKADKQLEGH